ncbi:hypothetical protein SESBI_24394 [Sesbania bispinosa]|nr:hypothetical protein SESBI_24394 [Sesbania bispinosa]
MRPQYGEIEKIVEEVISILGHKVSSPLDDLVGMQSREEEQLEKLLALDSDSDDDVPVVRMGSKRIKLLKHAGSLNYKRLLPFLLNTRKDDSCDSANDHHPKRQKCLDQTPLLPISASNLEVTPLSDSNVCVPLEDCKANYGTQQKAGFHACDLSNAGSSSRSQIPEFQSSHESCKVIQLQDEQVVLNGLCKLESSTNPPNSDHRIDLPITPLTRPTNEVTREDGASASDRAVEFSRNLLLDAEEVAQDLMKELSHLRNMLERSTHSVHNNHVFDGSQFQVKEACFKALATEQLAKDRLSQMNDDLDIHCRILRPRVRFAEHVEEKVIQPDR